MLTLDLLPRELLLSVFSFLSFTDLKQAVAVSKRFSEVGTEPKLWKHFKLFVSGRNIKQLRKILRLNKLRDLRSIVFLDCVLKTGHLRLVQGDMSRLCSHWSSSYITALSLVESFEVMLRQLSYAIKNQLKAPKASY